MKQIIKGPDLFARKLNFTFKGDDCFKTTFGGFISYIVILLTLVYMFYLLIYTFERKLTSTQTKIFYKNFLNEQEILFPAEEGFDLALMFEVGDGINLLSNKSVLSYEISHVHQFYWTNP